MRTLDSSTETQSEVKPKRRYQPVDDSSFGMVKPTPDEPTSSRTLDSLDSGEEVKNLKEQYKKIVEETEKASYNSEAISQDYAAFISWLQSELEALKRYSQLPSSPDFAQLNDALAHHEGIMLGVIGTHNVLRAELLKAEKLYTKTFARCSEEIRKKYNSDEKAATKFLGQKALDNATMVEYAETLDPLEHRRDMLSLKEKAINDLQESWKAFNINLNVLSKNVQVEAATTKWSKSELLDVDGDKVVF